MVTQSSFEALPLISERSVADPSKARSRASRIQTSMTRVFPRNGLDPNARSSTAKTCRVVAQVPTRLTDLHLNPSSMKFLPLVCLILAVGASQAFADTPAPAQSHHHKSKHGHHRHAHKSNKTKSKSNGSTPAPAAEAQPSAPATAATGAQI